MAHFAVGFFALSLLVLVTVWPWTIVLLLIPNPRLRGHTRTCFFSSSRRHTSSLCDWSSDVCASDLLATTLSAADATVYVDRKSVV